MSRNRPIVRKRPYQHAPRKTLSPWTVIGWMLVFIIGFIIFINMVIGCAIVSIGADALNK